MGTTQSLLLDETQVTSKIKKSDCIKFYLQDKVHSVKTENLTPTTSLNSYIRKTLHLTGTKGMCYEGGCGCCVVVIQKKDPTTAKNVTLSVNSCLMPILSCTGYKIYTSEGIGNPLNGYHPVQQVLAKFNGTQCGFCSPGMVMNMYALHESGKLTMQEVEDAFGGNLCRCTGYRPILSAFKSLTTDTSADLLGHIPDIEDVRVCPKERFVEINAEDCGPTVEEPFYHLFADNSKWIKLFTLHDLLITLKLYKDSRCMLVAGNTAQGVYKSYKEPVDVYIDVTSIPELSEHNNNGDFYVLGGNVTLTQAIELLTQTGYSNSKFAYFKQVAKHIGLIANVPVRNRGTLAGNLMIKHDHHEFPSDIFLLLTTIKARLTIVNAISGEQVDLDVQNFLNYDMNSKVLLNIKLPSYSNSYNFVSYKIMPRAQNAHAIVNAGFLFKFNQNQNLDTATIVFGNINNTFVHAVATEKLLSGKSLFDNATLQAVYKSLRQEVISDSRPPDPSPQYRNQLAVALFYKAVLSIAPAGKVSTKNKSGGTLLERPISKGAQDYETKESLYPLTQAIPKIEALAQTSGQAQYIGDIPDLPYQLFGVLILAKAPPGSTIKTINADKALNVKGVVAFFDKNDIPGDNNFSPKVPLLTSPEEIFCSGKILYYDQPIGVLVGKNEDIVRNAVGLVEVSYNPPTSRPLLSVRQVLKQGKTEKIQNVQTIYPHRRGKDVKHVVKGKFDIYQQYHFHMETLCCNVVPTEDGLDVYPASQYMDAVQVAIAKMLKIFNNKISITVRRCGGAYGAKISRVNIVACAAALAAWKLRQPVKLALPLSTNMRAIGKRYPFSVDYEVGVNDKGVIQYLDSTLYTDMGAVSNEDHIPLLVDGLTSVYNTDTFKFQINKVNTDTPTNCYARAPGTTEAVAALETIMDHVSYSIKVDPLQIRVANLPQDSSLLKYFDDLKSWADVDKRRQNITNFNKVNRWKKMGLSVVPMGFHFLLDGPRSAMVSIFHDDGTVQVSHGGVEMGQGINTKAAQVCAYKLGIPLEKVVVKPNNNFVSPNNPASGNTKTSEAICYGIIEACDTLLKRIEPYRNQLPMNASWKEVIQKCQENFVDLTATGAWSPNKPGVQAYPIYGICACEVLVDVLTGQYFITRVDIIEDVGQSMSPLVDIGQVEGAFVMGMGYHTTEKIQFDQDGQILTKNTWTYHVPGAKDIPADFRVKFPKNNPNPLGVLKSKGIGEPPLCLSASVPLALRNAMASARTDADSSNSKWCPIDGPTDVESVFVNCLNNVKQYTL